MTTKNNKPDGKELENLNKNSNWGGARQGAGRPKGSENESTKRKRIALEKLEERILKNVDRMFNAQMKLAEGCTFLYKVETDEKGKKRPAQLVTDPEEIKAYLDEEVDDPDCYYYISTQKPDNRALDSLQNRAFGRATEHKDITTGGKPIGKVLDELEDPIIDEE